MKKVLISMAIVQSALIATTAFAGSSSGIIRFVGEITHDSCIATANAQSANTMELKYCAGAAPEVSLEIQNIKSTQLKAGQPYPTRNPEKALKERDIFSVSYATPETIPANASVNYLVSYN